MNEPNGEIWRDAMVVTVVAAIAYYFTATAAYLGGDHGIFAIVAADGGYGHAPGYPLFSILLQGLSWIPGDTWVHVSSRATGVIAAFAVGVSYIACRRWGATRYGALLATLLFAFAPHVWLLHTQAEVFALNHLIVASILAIAHPGSHWRGRAAVLGLLFGFGASHHHTAVFMVPLGLLALIEDSRRHRPGVVWGTFAAGFATGLLPLSWLVWVSRAHPERWHWGDASTLEGFQRLFLRQDYGTFQVASEATTTGPLDQLRFLLSGWVDDFTMFGLILAIIGVVSLLSRTGMRRRWAWVFTVSLVFSGPLFVALLTRAPDGADYLLVRKFHMMFELLTVIPLSVGASHLFAWLRPGWRPFLFAGAIVTWVFINLQLVGMAQDRSVDVYCRDFWGSVPPDAIVIGSGDHNAICAEYMRRAQGVHPNASYIPAQLLVHDWYRARVARELSIDATVQGETVMLLDFVNAALATGRPVFFTDAFAPQVLQKLRSYPRGLVIRVLPSNVRVPTPREVAYENAIAFEDFELAPNQIGLDEMTPWRILIQRRYAQTWRMIAGALDHAGDVEGADHARTMEKMFAP